MTVVKTWIEGGKINQRIIPPEEYLVTTTSTPIANRIHKLIYDATLFCRPEEIRMDLRTYRELEDEMRARLDADKPFMGCRIVIEHHLPIWKKAPRTEAPKPDDEMPAPDRILCIAGRASKARDARWFYLDEPSS